MKNVCNHFWHHNTPMIEILPYGTDQHSPFDKENVFLLNADINHYLAIFLALNGH